MPAWSAIPVLAATDPFDKPTYDIVKGDIEFLKPLFARKTADESVTSSTALQNDDHLVLPVAANAVYLLDMLLFTSGHAGGDIKIKFTLPAAATLLATVVGFYVGASFTAATMDNSVAIPEAVAVNPVSLSVRGVLVISGTAGNAQLQWAQNVSDAIATKVLTNSYFALTQVV